LKRFGLAVLPLAIAGLLALLQAVLPDESAVVSWLQVQVLVLKALSFVFLLFAVTRFKPGEYLFGAWGFLALEPVFLLVKDLFFEDLSHVSLSSDLSPGLLWARAAFVFAGNACDVIGFILLLNAARKAGLEPAGSRSLRTAAFLGGLVLAAVLAGPAILADGQAALNGSRRALGDLFSDLGDAVAIVLVMPLLLRAWAFRGGLLIWPYAMIALAALCYLWYDIVWAIGPSLWQDLTVRRVDEFFRAAGLLYFCAAGLAQGLILRKKPSAS
jgi:hypothetical protein